MTPVKENTAEELTDKLALSDAYADSDTDPEKLQTAL